MNGFDFWEAKLLAMLMGHALADFPLQGQFLAEMKNRHAKKPARNPLWVHCMTAHALIHAAFVWAITGSMTLGLAEFFAHWLIDFAKCEGWIDFDQDQALHWFCKFVYAPLA